MPRSRYFIKLTTSLIVSCCKCFCFFFVFNYLSFFFVFPPTCVQSPRHGSSIHAVGTTTTCLVPSSTHARSSFCPTLRTRASGCGTCPKGPEYRPSAVITTASGCWVPTQTSTCLLQVSADSDLIKTGTLTVQTSICKVVVWLVLKLILCISGKIKKKKKKILMVLLSSHGLITGNV